MARKPSLDPEVQELLTETKPGRDEHDVRVRGYDKAYDVYRATTPTPAGRPTWQSKLRVKYGMQVIDTAMVNLAQGKPRCKVMPRSPDYEESAKKFQLAIDYYTAQAHLQDQVPATVQQALIFGVTVGKNHWLYKKGQQPGRDWPTNPFTQEVYPQDVTRDIVYYDGPFFEPWDINDAWWDPNGRSVDDAEYVALRSYATKSELEQKQADGIYQNVEELLRTGTTPRSASAQERLAGGDQNLRKGRFEIVEYWRDRSLTVVGNQQILMRKIENPHWHGKKPVVIASCRPDLFKISGIPETELVRDLQDALHTIENMRMDNLHMTVMRGLTYREGGIQDPNLLVLMPRFKWGVTDHDDIRMIDMPPLPPEAYREEEALLARLQYVTGITPYVSGAGTNNIDQNTATGISILSSAAGALLQFKRQQIHFGIWQRTFEQWGADIQQFMTEPVWIRLMGAGGSYTFEHVHPQDVAGEYEYVLEGTEESLSRQQERQEALGLLQALAPIMGLGIVNPKPILERVAAAFGFDNPEELFAVHQQAPPAAPFPPQNGQVPTPPGGQQLVHGGMLPLPVHQAVIQGR